MLNGSTICYNYELPANNFEKAFSDSSTLYRDMIDKNKTKADLIWKMIGSNANGNYVIQWNAGLTTTNILYYEGAGKFTNYTIDNVS